MFCCTTSSTTISPTPLTASGEAAAMRPNNPKSVPGAILNLAGDQLCSSQLDLTVQENRTKVLALISQKTGLPAESMALEVNSGSRRCCKSGGSRARVAAISSTLQWRRREVQSISGIVDSEVARAVSYPYLVQVRYRTRYR